MFCDSGIKKTVHSIKTCTGKTANEFSTIDILEDIHLGGLLTASDHAPNKQIQFLTSLERGQYLFHGLKIHEAVSEQPKKTHAKKIGEASKVLFQDAKRLPPRALILGLQ